MTTTLQAARFVDSYAEGDLFVCVDHITPGVDHRELAMLKRHPCDKCMREFEATLPAGEFPWSDDSNLPGAGTIARALKSAGLSYDEARDP
jgi:hypothetical protein